MSSELVLHEASPAHPDYSKYVRKTAQAMAAQFVASTKAIRRLVKAIDAESNKLADTFRSGKGRVDAQDHVFSVRIVNKYNHSSQTLDDVIKEMRRQAWVSLVDRLNVKSTMSMAAQEKLDRQLREDKLPNITEDAIVNMIMGMASQLNDFKRDAVKEVFDYLRPHNNGRRKLKTNSDWKIGSKVIVSGCTFRPSRPNPFSVDWGHCDNYLRAVEGVFLLLDGKTAAREDSSQNVIDAICAAGRDGRFDTTYISGRCYMNGRIHLKFKRMDLVEQINACAAGQAVLRKEQTSSDS